MLVDNIQTMFRQYPVPTGLVKSWSIVGQSLVNPGQKLATGQSMWPTFDQDLTNLLVKCYLKRGKSKVGQVDHPLTNIRLIISGQCFVSPHVLTCRLFLITLRRVRLVSSQKIPASSWTRLLSWRYKPFTADRPLNNPRFNTYKNPD